MLTFLLISVWTARRRRRARDRLMRARDEAPAANA
jgi:hypothetical protein